MLIDLSGNVYCLDLKTGKPYWKYEAYAAIWSSPMVADGKVYVGDEDGDIAILRQGKKLEVIDPSERLPRTPAPSPKYPVAIKRQATAGQSNHHFGFPENTP